MTDNDLVDALAQLSFRVQGTLAGIAAGHDLSLVQTRLLGIVRDHEPTMLELGRHLGLDKSSVTGLVARAQARGLVERIPDATDRRVARVSITPAGRELAEQVAAVFAQHIHAYAAGLPARDRATLARLAQQVADSAA